MRNAIKPCTPLVVRLYYVPRSMFTVGGGKHVIAGTGKIVPAAVCLQVHRRQLPQLAWIVDSLLEAPSLFFHPHFKPVLHQNYSCINDVLLECGGQFEKMIALVFAGEPH